MTEKDPTIKPWGGRFSEPTDAFVERFTASVTFDKRMYHHDINGSLACPDLAGKQIFFRCNPGSAPRLDVRNECFVDLIKQCL